MTGKNRERYLAAGAMTSLWAALIVLSFAEEAVAQGPQGFDKQAARVTLDFRVGALWPGREAIFAPPGTRFSFGARVAPYLGREGVAHRFSIPIGFDYVHISRYEYFDPGLGSDARFREQYVVIGPGLGFDVVQTRQVDLTVRYGAAAVGNLTTFELPNIYDYDEWEDVCHLSAFEGYCPSDWNFLGNAGASLRLFPKQDFPLYFGVDYTRYAGLKNQLVGTVGFVF